MSRTNMPMRKYMIVMELSNGSFRYEYRCQTTFHKFTDKNIQPAIVFLFFFDSTECLFTSQPCRWLDSFGRNRVAALN